MAQAAAHGLANAGLTVSSLSTGILIVLVFGAASDYALLLVHRYREELQHGGTAEDAMAAAMRHTLPTLLASAGTVICAMICLLAAQSASLHGLGPVGALGIISALLAQTTFLPALLLVLGRAAFWPRIRVPATPGARSPAVVGRGPPRGAPPGPGRDRGRAAARRGLRRARVLRTDNSPLGDVKGHPGSVAGAYLLEDHFPPGIIDPITILAPASQARAAAATARSMPDIGMVLPAAPLGNYKAYSVVLSAPPYGPTRTATVAALRQRLDRDAPGALVGSDPAVQYDIAQAANRDDLVLIPLVLVVTLVMIALLLQAIVAPLVLVATTALSFGASFGLSSLLWRFGLRLRRHRVQIRCTSSCSWSQLGVDYNIFLTARIREESANAASRRAPCAAQRHRRRHHRRGRGARRHVPGPHPAPIGDSHEVGTAVAIERAARRPTGANGAGPRPCSHWASGPGGRHAGRERGGRGRPAPEGRRRGSPGNAA